MSDIIIQLENISKQYRLGVVNTRTLKADVQRWVARVRGKEDPFLKVGQENILSKSQNRKANDPLDDYIWALRDINLEVKQGQVLGIIGKNGAGKSTLLKLLSRVTAPTTGEIKVAGRIASLLEVGTGFHPELTGRENIFLNGAILGMTKTEIRSKFDEIVDFSGVEKYIDTPVKRYSSGMYVRLAFAVAAHLDPEILIIDEVLAVGDADFQKKALGKMQNVSKEDGRTVLFVSHNMAAVKSLCNSGLIMLNGKIHYQGDVNTAVSMYLSTNTIDNIQEYKEFKEGSSIVHPLVDILSVGIRSNQKKHGEPMCLDDEIVLDTEIFKKSNESVIDITFHIKNSSGETIMVISSDSSLGTVNYENKGHLSYRVVFPSVFFNAETFYIDLYVVKDKKRAIIIEKDILFFNILEEQKGLGEWMGKEPGYFRPKLEWSSKNI
jgi:lipopolysaccharide transport system ATP-binding protein